MHKVDLYKKVRIDCLRKRKSQRSVSRQYGISRHMVSKMLAYPEPPGYRKIGPRPKPQLDAYEEFINGILENDRHVNPKQRHTSQRVFSRLCEETDYQGSYSIRWSHLFGQVSSKVKLQSVCLSYAASFIPWES